MLSIVFLGLVLVLNPVTKPHECLVNPIRFDVNRQLADRVVNVVETPQLRVHSQRLNLEVLFPALSVHLFLFLSFDLLVLPNACLSRNIYNWRR